MKLLVSIWKELIGLFVDDGALAALSAGLIAVLAVAVMWLSLDPLLAALALPLGCILILGWSVSVAVKRH